MEDESLVKDVLGIQSVLNIHVEIKILLCRKEMKKR